MWQCWSRKWFAASHQPCSCWFDMHDSLQTRKKSFHNFYTTYYFYIYIYPDFLVESLNKKKYTLNLRFQMCIFANVDLRRDKLEKITRIIKLFCAWLSIVSVLTDEVKILSFFDPDFLYVRKGRSDG